MGGSGDVHGTDPASFWGITAAGWEFLTAEEQRILSVETLDACALLGPLVRRYGNRVIFHLPDDFGKLQSLLPYLNRASIRHIEVLGRGSEAFKGITGVVVLEDTCDVPICSLSLGPLRPYLRSTQQLDPSPKQTKWLFEICVPTTFLAATEEILEILDLCGFDLVSGQWSAADPDRPEEVVCRLVCNDSGHARYSIEQRQKYIETMIYHLGTFCSADNIQKRLLKTGLIRPDFGSLARAMARFAHQVLLYEDPFAFNLANCEDALCAYPSILRTFCRLFEARFHPTAFDDEQADTLESLALQQIDSIYSGHEQNDRRRKQILRQALNLIRYTLKTTFYSSVQGLGFRLSTQYMHEAPARGAERFTEIPHGIFLIFHQHSFGFHIRFRDLARGGLRTVIPQHMEQYSVERNQLFMEAYNLSFTQQRKNKDIPEGGAKGVILLYPFAQEKYLSPQASAPAYRQQLARTCQKGFAELLLCLVNADEEGFLRDRQIRDLLGAPEYLYLGPDENMTNEMITWMAHYAQQVGYIPGKAFISSKPGIGINHKEYGVTSLGVHTYVEEGLKFLNIDPTKQPFTVKMTGGPGGDVAGNELLNLSKWKHASLQVILDGTGLLYDPTGIDLEVMVKLVQQGANVNDFPIEKLHPGAFIIHSQSERVDDDGNSIMLQVSTDEAGKVVETWFPASEVRYTLSNKISHIATDLFIPAGGRPRTINIDNVAEFCDSQATPSATLIVEGANLFITPEARRYLEERGVLIFKDSSANKGGVICSSYEVLFGLTLSDDEFLELKPTLMPEVLGLIKEKARLEAYLLLNTYSETGRFLTELSEQVSVRINQYKDQLLHYFESTPINFDEDICLRQILLGFCPPTLVKLFEERIVYRLPAIHQHAILASQIASLTVYLRGLDWVPTIIDALPQQLDAIAAFSHKKGAGNA